MRLKLLPFIFLLTCLNTVFSQDKKSQDILNKVSSKMKALKCFYLEFNSLVKNSANQKTENLTGKGWVKGNKFNATFDGNTIISNGMKTWTVIKEEKSVYESDANSDDGSINPKKIMTIWETGFKNKYEREELLNGEKVHVITLTPKSPSNSEFKSIVIYISKSTNSLKQAYIKSKDGSIITYNVTKFQENPSLQDSKFSFDKKNYPGYKVVRD